jgi:hypothetical protein
MTMEERGKSKWLGNFYQSTRHHVEELTKLLISLHSILNSTFLQTPYGKSDLNVCGIKCHQENPNFCRNSM